MPGPFALYFPWFVESNTIKTLGLPALKNYFPRVRVLVFDRASQSHRICLVFSHCFRSLFIYFIFIMTVIRTNKVSASHLLSRGSTTVRLLDSSSPIKALACLQPSASIHTLSVCFFLTVGIVLKSVCWIFPKLIRSPWETVLPALLCTGINNNWVTHSLARLFRALWFFSVVIFCNAVKASMLSEHTCIPLWPPSRIVSWSAVTINISSALVCLPYSFPPIRFSQIHLRQVVHRQMDFTDLAFLFARTTDPIFLSREIYFVWLAMSSLSPPTFMNPIQCVSFILLNNAVS